MQKETRKGYLGEVCVGNTVTYCVMEWTDLGTPADPGPGIMLTYE